MGDLQCPATILLFARESIAPVGAPERADAGHGHMAGVYVASAVADDPSGLAAAAAFAGERACRLVTMPDVADGSGLARAIEELADLHRGETIAVVGTRAMIQHLLGDRGAGPEFVAVAVDGAGWRVAPA